MKDLGCRVKFQNENNKFVNLETSLLIGWPSDSATLVIDLPKAAALLTPAEQARHNLSLPGTTFS